MLLLVVGLIVIVLVILVAVFLSVRSMRADESGDYQDRPARPDRAGNSRDDFAGAGRRGNSPQGEIRRPPLRRRQAGDDWAAGQEPGYGQTAAMAAQDYDSPRGYRGQDPDAGERELQPVPRRQAAVPAARPAGAAASRRFGSLARPRGHQHDEGAGTDRADWPASDWGGLSDEQYWAELSADKPLATTARSAQPGIDARPAAPARSGDAAAADGTGRRARRDSAAQFRLRPGSGVPQPQAAAEPWTPSVSTAGGSDTDPGISGRDSWQDTAGEGPATASWAAPGTDETSTWAAEDPLTSPSFSVPSTYSADSSSYPAPAWDSSYAGRTDDWACPSHEYPSGPLEPLPGPASSAAEPAGSWYPAPTLALDERSYAGPSGHAWDQGEVRHDQGSGPDSDPLSWQAPEPDYAAGTGYGDTAGYPPPDDRGTAPDGYGSGHGHDGYQQASQLPGTGDSYQLPGHGYDSDAGYGPGSGDAGSGPSAYEPLGTAYQLPDYSSAGPGYGPDGYEPGDGGYQQSPDRPGSTGYEPSAYDPGDPGYPQPGYGSAGGDYPLPDHGSGNGHYPGYNGRR